nr:MAG TPA: hypothetical protein [Caudoviricetes sp.]
MSVRRGQHEGLNVEPIKYMKNLNKAHDNPQSFRRPTIQCFRKFIHSRSSNIFDLTEKHQYKERGTHGKIRSKRNSNARQTIKV